MQVDGTTNYSNYQTTVTPVSTPSSGDTVFTPVEGADSDSQATNYDYNVNSNVAAKTKNMSTDEKAQQLTESEKNQLPVSDRFMVEVVKKANKELVKAGRELEMSVHAKTKQVIVKVKDKNSGEVIREIPSEKLLDMYASMLERAGLLVDEKR